MHELGIAGDLFKIVKKKSEQSDLKKVTKIRIKVGAASGIDMEFLQHSFNDHIFPGTIAQGAELELIPEPVQAQCNNCGRNIDAQGHEFSRGCPFCGSSYIEIITGKEVYIESIEGE